MKKTTTSERVSLMLDRLNLDQVEFGLLAGASKSVVNQWVSGLIKKVGPKYAYNIENKAGYRKEWVMFGEGDPMIPPIVKDCPGGSTNVDTPTLNPDDQRFIRMVTEAIQTREVPQHVRDSVLLLLGSSPAKAQDAPQQMVA